MKTFIVSIVIIILGGGGIFAQDIPDDFRSQSQANSIVPIAPNSKSILAVGDIPIDYSKGEANISIKLYDFKVGNITIPIVLRYNTGGIKVNDSGSTLGLGWSLDVGGGIYRTINGLSDDDFSGWLNNSYDIEDFESGNASEDATLGLIMANQIDLSPDEFSYQFLGQSGQFIFDNDKNMRQLFDSNVKIEPIYEENSTGIEFSATDYFDTNTNQSSFARLSKKIIGFKATDIYGNIYNFESIEYNSKNEYGGQLDDVEAYTGSKLPRNNSNGSIGWKLRSIDTPANSNDITFGYDSHIFKKTVYSNTSYFFYNSSQVGTPFQKEGYTSYNKLLSNIEAGHHSVDIVYEDVYVGENENVWDKRISEIIIKYDNNLLDTEEQTIKFKMSYSNFPSSRRYKLKNITKETDVGSELQYSFQYYTCDNFPVINSPQQDYFGYFNYATTNDDLFLATPSLESTSNLRSVNASSICAGNLKAISYPTGGEKVFYYAPHKDGNKIAPGVRISQILTKDGTKKATLKRFSYYGLRAETSLDLSTHSLADYFKSDPLSKITGDPELFEIFYNPITMFSNYQGNNISRYIKPEPYYDSVGVYIVDANERLQIGDNTYGGAPKVTYHFEYLTVDKQLKSRNKTTSYYKAKDEGYALVKREEYDYSNLTPPERIVGKFIDGMVKHLWGDFEGVFFLDTYVLLNEHLWDYGYSRSNLTDKTVYEYLSNGVQKTKTRYTYSIHDQYAKQLPVSIITYGDKYYYSISNKYPFDLNDSNHSAMTAKLMYGYPIVKTVTSLDYSSENIQDPPDKEELPLLIKESIINYIRASDGNYLATANLIQDGSVSLSDVSGGNNIVFDPTSTQEGISLQNTVEGIDIMYNIIQSYDIYDSSGNLCQKTSSNGIVESYYWGQTKDYPLITAVNLDYNNLLSNVANYVYERDFFTNYTNYDDNYLIPNPIPKSPLKNAQVQFFSHNPLFGIARHIDANGRATFFDYDDMGRLEFVRNMGGDIIERHKHNFRTPKYYNDSYLSMTPIEHTGDGGDGGDGRPDDDIIIDGLTITPNEDADFSKSGGTKSYQIISDTEWTAIANYVENGVTYTFDWISTSKSGNTLSITVGNYDNGRTGYMTVSNDSGSKTIKVVQNYEGVIVVE